MVSLLFGRLLLIAVHRTHLLVALGVGALSLKIIPVLKHCIVYFFFRQWSAANYTSKYFEVYFI